MTKAQMLKIKLSLDALVLSGPGGISAFLVMVQSPIHLASNRLEEARNNLLKQAEENETVCGECGQERSLSLEERHRIDRFEDAADQLDSYANRLDDTICTFSEFDPSWVTGECE